MSAEPKPPESPRPYPARTDRERLMEAVVRVAASKGYGATTVADVSAAAGVSEEEFDRHFQSKEDCFLAAYEALSNVLVAHVSHAYDAAAGQPWPDRIVAGLRALLELLAEEAEVARVAIIEIASFGEDARIRYWRALERFVPFLEDGREHCEKGDGLPPDTAQFAIGGGAAMIFDEIRAGRGEVLPVALPALAYAVLMPYLGAAAAEAEMERIAAG